MDESRFAEFVAFAQGLKGDEKSEAQTFLTRLFQAFGHAGPYEAGATFEHRIRIDGATKFSDLLWPGRVLIEMKSRGVKLDRVFPQAKAYWDNAYADRTEYVVLCNFDEFVVYNWNLQREPLDTVKLEQLPEMWRSLAFLAAERTEPIFGNNLVALTKEAADRVADLYGHLVDRGIARETAQRFVLQCLVCLFAEDTGLFPDRYTFLSLVRDCREGQSRLRHLPAPVRADELARAGGWRALPGRAVLRRRALRDDRGDRAGRGGAGPARDGGEIGLVEGPAVDLREHLRGQPGRKGPAPDGGALHGRVGHHADRGADGAPALAGADRGGADARGVERIGVALGTFRVLDPSCGSGNFLYVAFREMKDLELELYRTMLERFPSVRIDRIRPHVTARQFYGIDTNPLGVEMAKVTLSMAKKFAADNFNKFTRQHRFLDEAESPLPFDNLDANIVVADALFTKWPEAEAIIGNPPFQSQTNMLTEFGPPYMQKLRAAYPDISGYADYCVYWFRRAQDALHEGGRAGLVGTNTIRENLSRESGLDYIVHNGGTIIEAVGTMPWSGEAAVHVSLVNWIKGTPPAGPYPARDPEGG